MKVNKLMIGDWVKRNGKPEQVDWVFMQCAGDAIQAGFTEDQMVTIEFIPLTEEILKANGWSYSKSCYAFTNDNPKSNCYFLLNIGKPEISVRWDSPEIWCNHVHELQHALRLCGLNDLADNFKIS